jgi:3-oxoacyl-[acyl-carrier protein] reductase
MEMDMNDNPTSPRAALVTGATGGMGSAIAARLAADGIAVGIHYGGRRMPAEELSAKIAAGGGHSVVVSGDVADEHAMAEAFEQIERAFGGLDVVVNTAGIMVLAPLEKFDLVELDRMHRTNIRGTFVVSQQAARRVRSGGAIINFSTSQVKLQFPTYSAYAASKGAVNAMTLVLARELRGRDITVNAVAPGPIATPLFFDGKDQETVDRFEKAAPLERLGTPADVAELVSFLAGPARWINGQILYVNGGVA